MNIAHDSSLLLLASSVPLNGHVSGISGYTQREEPCKTGLSHHLGDENVPRLHRNNDILNTLGLSAVYSWKEIWGAGDVKNPSTLWNLSQAQIEVAVSHPRFFCLNFNLSPTQKLWFCHSRSFASTIKTGAINMPSEFESRDWISLWTEIMNWVNINKESKLQKWVPDIWKGQ